MFNVLKGTSPFDIQADRGREVKKNLKFEEELNE